ncbi:MAG: hypothetical protein ACI9AD_001670 [Nitriliruptoraceae bacterium]|jgi:hypothetical protein
MPGCSPIASRTSSATTIRNILDFERDYPDATIIGVVGSVVMSTDGAAEARSGLWAVSRV